MSAAFTGAVVSPARHSVAPPAVTRSSGAVSSVVISPNSHPSGTTALTAPGASARAALLGAIKSSHVDPRTVYPPNLLYAATMRSGVLVAPTYPEAPEPAGLADYGVNNSTGTPKSFTIDTTSYKATLTLNSVQPYYLANYNPEAFSSQLNVILKNVTLFGKSTFTFWTQNVVYYDAYSSQLILLDNVWNFSNTNPATDQPASTFYKTPGYTNGTAVVETGLNYYYDVGAVLNGITLPFTAVLYINATTLDLAGTNYSEADFTIAMLNGAGVQQWSHSYDRVLFNNTGFPGPIPQAKFHVDGTNITPTGYIPYDAEIMLGGPGGGSTATFQGLNASMTLQHWDAGLHKYVNEPTAWSSGSETGETSVGVAEYYTSNDVVHLGSGPEFIQPFWNSSATATAGAAVLSGTITPSNSWAFATAGSSYNVATSAWGAIPVSGAYSWSLTAGTYTVKVMESDFDPTTSAALTLTSGHTTTFSPTLTADATAGIYTPLYAMANSQLAAISSGGTGTESDPYMIANNEVENLSAEFASLNDYGFPSYAGISLRNTNAYVVIENPAPFLVIFWGASLEVAVLTDAPSSNDLSTWLFNTSHVSIVSGTISGWFGEYLTGFPFANVVIWNSTGDLVAGNTFDVSTVAIYAYGGGGNSFIANTFLSSPLPYSLMYPYIAPHTLDANIGMIESESGDSIWNNYFATEFTAWESSINEFDDFYPSVTDLYSNHWNLTAPIPATTVTVINGISITGAVGNYPYACGNGWYDYIPGVTALPYDEYAYDAYVSSVPLAFIETGGDYCPAGSLGTLLFSESGLASGTAWSVTVNGAQLSGTTATLDTVLANGTYTFTVGTVAGYTATYVNEPVTVVAQGGVTTVSILFKPVTPPPEPDGTLALSVSPTTATVWVDGAQVTLSSGSYSASVTPGVHSIEVSDSGFYTYYNNVTVKSNETTSVPISLNAVTVTTTTTTSGINTAGWAIIALLGVLALIFLITTVIFAGRSRRRGGPPMNASPEQWRETPPTNPPGGGPPS